MNQTNKKIDRRGLVIFIVVLIIIFCYFSYMIYQLVVKPTNTFIVENGKISLEEAVQGYIIRDETVLKGENYKNGLVQIKAEGEKVAKGEAIFRYYTNGEEELNKKIKELDVKIQEALNNENVVFSGDIKILDQQIEEKLTQIYHVKDVQKIKEYKKDMDTYLNKKAKIAGEKSPAGSYLKKLIEERSGYENELNSGAEYLNATRAGIVSYRVDGLEEVLTPSSFGSLSKKMLEDLNLKTGQIISSSDEGGKIIDNYVCYIACILNKNNFEEKNAKIGDKIKIRLSNKEQINAEIMYVSQENSYENLVVFKLDKYVEQLINYRKISFDIIWWDISGWKVPNDAIKYESNDLAYVIRRRVGYSDKIYIQVLKQGEKYSIISNYDSGKELIDKGVEEEFVNNRKKISLYDEVEI